MNGPVGGSPPGRFAPRMRGRRRIVARRGERVKNDTDAIRDCQVSRFVLQSYSVRTLTLTPSHLSLSIVEHHDRQVGMLTLAGSGQFADIVLEVVLDLPTLGSLEAAAGEARQKLVAAA